MQRVFRVVDTAMLSPAGVKSTTAFNRSVRKHGILTPVLLAEVPDEDGVIGLEIVDGNRRVRAARSIGLARIPAVVLKEITAEDRARLTLLTNNLRSRNVLTECDAALTISQDIPRLSREVRKMGLGVAKVVGLVEKMQRMPESIWLAMFDERVPVSVATMVAGWPSALQQEAVQRLNASGRLDTRAANDLKARWESQHGSLTRRTEPRQTAPAKASAPEWKPVDPIPMDDDPIQAASAAVAANIEGVNGDRQAHPRLGVPVHVRSIPVPAWNDTEWNGEPDAPVMLRSERSGHTSENDSGEHRSSIINAGAGTPSQHPGPDDLSTFLPYLDATLKDLVGRSQQHGMSRTAWIDRALRAWDRTEAR